MMVLQGIRVVDWTVFHAGPSCSAMLADLGAEVIHVEEREHGDLFRGHRVSRGVSYELPFNRHVLFEDLNRNKKSLAVDLTQKKGREVVYRLVEKCDVFVTNFRHRAALKLGMDYATLKLRNPRLIYASASAFGEKGPEADRPGLEDTGYARSGAMLASGEEGQPPIHIATGIGDRITGVYLAYGVLAALLARERLGVSQQVTTSQLGALIALQSASFITELLTMRPYPRLERAKARNPIFNYYQCQDGRWILLACSISDRYWPRVCWVLGIEELEKDPRFADAEKRSQNCAELVSILDQVFSTRTAEEWESRLKQEDIIFSRICAISDLLSDPQVLENGYILEWDHPVLGQQKFMGFPVQWSETPASLRLPAPELGEHTEEVLSEICGYSWEEIAGLREQRAV